MSEEEIIKILKSLIREVDFIDYEENQPKIDEAIQGLLDLYNKEKKKNKRYEKYLRNKDIEHEKNLEYIETEIETDYIPKSKVREKIEILEKCTTNIDRKVNLTDYMIIGETERAIGIFVNLDFIKKVLLEEPGYDIELLQEGDK